MKQLKKTSRPERKNSRCRVVSLHFPMGMEEVAKKDRNYSFIPNNDYMVLLKKYEWLVKRRRKEIERNKK